METQLKPKETQREQDITAHETWVLEPDGAIVSNLGNIWCELCNNILCGAGHYADHMNGKLHKKNVLRRARGCGRMTDEDPFVDDDGCIHCPLCDMWVKNQDRYDEHRNCTMHTTNERILEDAQRRREGRR